MPDVSVVTADNLGADFDVGVVETNKVNIKRAGATTYGLVRLNDITAPSGVFSLLATSTVVGSTIDSSPIGGSTPASGAFTTLSSDSVRVGGGTFVSSEVLLASRNVAGSGATVAVIQNSGTTSGTGASVNFVTNTNASAAVAIAAVSAVATDTAGTGDILFTTANVAAAAERARITGAGQFLIGTSTPRNVSGAVRPFQIETAGTSASMSLIRNSADANGPSVAFGKSAGAAIGSVNAVALDDALGQITWAGSDGTNMSFNPSAQIQALVDGTVATGSVPSRLTFWTTNVATSTAVERMRISAAGNVGIGETSPVRKLHVNDDIQQNNGQYIRGKIAAGTTTRILGVNASDVMYVGSVDAPISSMLFSNNGASMATLTSTGLGIGMTPSYSVDVTKNANSTSAIRVINADAGTVADCRLILSNGTNIAASLILRGATNATDPNSLNISSGGAYDLHFFAGAAKRMTLDTAGSARILSAIGSSSTTTGSLIVTGGAGVSGAIYAGGLISTTQASAGSDVESLRLANSGAGANTKARLSFYTTGTNYASISGGYGAATPEMNFRIEGVSSGAFTWESVGAEVMRMNSVGNLGVGTISPLTRLVSATAYSAGAVTDAALFCQNTGANPSTGQGVRVHFSASSSITRSAAIEAAVSNGINGHHLSFLTNLAGAAATEKVRIDTLGNVLVGVTTPQAVQVLAGAFTPTLQTWGTSSATGLSTGRYAGAIAGAAAAISISRSRGTVIGTQVAVASGDTLGYLSWTGDDGTLFQEASRIAAKVDGTVSGTAMPGRLEFYTTPASSVTPAERLRIDSAGNVLAVSSGGIGYGSGSGGAVTQITSKATGVTLNKTNGAITMNAASLAATTAVSFVLTNSTIAVTDCVNVCVKSGGTLGAYLVTVDAVAAGSCTLSLRNLTAGALAEAVVITYVVIKAAIA